MFELDLTRTPFSRSGSYFAFSVLRGDENYPPGLYLRSLVPGQGYPAEVFHVELTDGAPDNPQPVPARISATPTLITLEGERGRAEICLAEPSVVRVQSTGAGLRFSSAAKVFDLAHPGPGNRWQVILFRLRTKLLMAPLAGHFAVSAPWHIDKCEHVRFDLLPDAPGGTAECAIEEFSSAWTPREYPESFAACKAAVETEFQAWHHAALPAPAELAAGRELAAYVTWSCLVQPRGNFRRPAMLMSKNWMGAVWSWDHCFNALALAQANPALAWDQLMVMFDLQDALGALPDSATPLHLVWSFLKPPIHGWTLLHLMRVPGVVTPERMRDVYEPLRRWTEFWLNWRDDDGDGLPQYDHGNDSGWDNATVFHDGIPVESPDLAAFLVLQMDALACLAEALGDVPAAQDWQRRADALLQRLLDTYWQGNRFVARRDPDHAAVEHDCLLLFIPIVLGQRLPAEIRSALTAGLREPGRFLTEYGLATENVSSPFYEPDGYWRGPIWAPSTYLIVDGLRAAGETALAQDIARRFCAMAQRSGMAENFDALTGDDLRDRAYSWTASVYLLLADLLARGV